MAMDGNTGRVVAMQGGFSYQYSVFNRATQARRQPGSSFKPFVYAAALDSGYSPATIVVDAPIEINTPQGLWRPKNSSNKFYGPTPLRTGIERSRNLMTIRLAQEVGMPVVAGYAERFGVYDNMGAFLANSLGAEATPLYKMVAAYAMFANGGEPVQPTPVDRVQDRVGNPIYRHHSPRRTGRSGPTPTPCQPAAFRTKCGSAAGGGGGRVSASGNSTIRAPMSSSTFRIRRGWRRRSRPTHF